MGEDIAADRTIQARLIKDMARRPRYSWAMYVLFCSFFAVQPEFGAGRSPGLWTFTFLMLVAGVLRMWIGGKVAGLPDEEVASVRGTMFGLVAAHSVLWGVFVAFALWLAYGDARLEMCIGIGVAGFATGGAVVLSGYPPLASLHLGIQCIPVLIWSFLARERVGLLVFALVVSFIIFVGLLMMANHRHIVTMFRALHLLEVHGEELQRAKETAEEASSARAQFLANMSHEIRTPLYGVLGLTQALGQTPLNDSQIEIVRALACSGSHLLVIVNDILDCSKIASGRLTLECVPFALRALVRDVTAPAEAMAQSKGLGWAVDCGKADCGEIGGTFRGDPVRIRQVLSNLLSNAVKFTESGEVRLQVKRDRPGWIRFTVIDTGIGISESQGKDLFQDFTQADASTTRRFGGTGLGLAISKRLVELMGGTLSMTSKPGCGSRFTAAIPLPEVGEDERVLQLEESGNGLADLPAGRRILLAEDNPINRMIAERFLAGTGAIVETAETGRVAVARHSAHPYDLILMDCHMPDMDGFEATAAIRVLGEGADVPIVAVTASAFAEDRERCRRAGMDGYIAKPLRREELIQAVAAALKHPVGKAG